MDIEERIFEKLDKLQNQMNDLCNRMTKQETIHELASKKFNQMLGLIGTLGIVIGMITYFT